MAIDSRNKRFSLLGEADAVAPQPDGSFDSAADRQQLLGLYAAAEVVTAPIQVVSVEGIVNLALTHLGEQPIESIEGTDKVSRLAKRVYDATRDALLEQFDWPFARKRAVLTKDASAPVWGYTARYRLPGDYILLRAIVGDADPDFAEEDGYLLYDGEAELRILYTYRNPTVTRYSQLFIQVLAFDLAAAMAGTLSEDPRDREQMLVRSAALLPVAKSRNSRRRGVRQLEHQDVLLRVR